MSPADPPATTVRWLDGTGPGAPFGVTWGVPWPRGTVAPATAFALRDGRGAAIPLQSWVLARWPDGSIKWSGHAIAVNGQLDVPFTLEPASGAGVAGDALRVEHRREAIEIDAGALRCRIPLSGERFVEGLSVAGREVVRAGRLVCILRDSSRYDAEGILRDETLAGTVESVVVEQEGPVRACVRITGSFAAGRAARFPFVLRLSFYAGVAYVNIVHTFVYDGDIAADFVAGLGVSFEVPMRGEPHNRHVRLAGGDGLFKEAVRQLPGWNEGFAAAHQGLAAQQVAGRRVADAASLGQPAQAQIESVASWGDFKLAQLSSDSFAIDKRTAPHSRWVRAAQGRRSRGLAYVGGPDGGAALGLRDFWQSTPAALEVLGAAGPVATVTAWLWSPDAPPMDMRHYDDKGHGLEIAYEDYRPGHSDARGVARTSVLSLWPLPTTPQDEQLMRMAAAGADGAFLACEPERWHAAGVFGVWSLPDRSHPLKARIEDGLDAALDFYLREVDRRHWYGFWDYGDVMHSYDAERHCWLYDVGGYAWANTELVPDMWLWYSFLRTRRADVFRMAEAMTRHVCEVDVHHTGPFAPLGSRHNVVHWGCGCKEARMSAACHKRFYYYLTADERTGELMDEVIEADRKLLELDPMWAYFPRDEHPTHARTGPDWTAFCSNWIAAWERTGDRRYRDKIAAGVESLAAMPNRFFSGPTCGYDPQTGRLFPMGGDFSRSYHMVTIFGGAEVCFEMADLLAMPEWDDMWLDFCSRYSRDAYQGLNDGERRHQDRYAIWHSRLAAFAAARRGDAAMKQRAWHEFLREPWGWDAAGSRRSRVVTGAGVIEAAHEIGWMSTNQTSCWSLNAIQNLALIGDAIPDDWESWLRGR